eukprot:scaffold45346_cov61-Phaeocystis_antarctica.AAC.5
MHGRGAAPRALSAPSPVCPAAPGRPRRGVLARSSSPRAAPCSSASPACSKRRSQRPQLAAGAAEGHGGTWIERVAQLAEDDALLVTAQRRERHRRAGATRGKAIENAVSTETEAHMANHGRHGYPSRRGVGGRGGAGQHRND